MTTAGPTMMGRNATPNFREPAGHDRGGQNSLNQAKTDPADNKGAKKRNQKDS